MTNKPDLTKIRNMIKTWGGPGISPACGTEMGELCDEIDRLNASLLAIRPIVDAAIECVDTQNNWIAGVSNVDDVSAAADRLRTAVLVHTRKINPNKFITTNNTNG